MDVKLPWQFDKYDGLWCEPALLALSGDAVGRDCGRNPKNGGDPSDPELGHLARLEPIADGAEIDAGPAVEVRVPVRVHRGRRAVNTELLVRGPSRPRL